MIPVTGKKNWKIKKSNRCYCWRWPMGIGWYILRSWLLPNTTINSFWICGLFFSRVILNYFKYTHYKNFYDLNFVHRYLTKRLKKSTKCEICIKSLNTEYGKSTNKAADLVNLKTRGFLTHPNNNLFLIIQQVELCFEKYADSSNPFENTFEDFFQNEK